MSISTNHVYDRQYFEQRYRDYRRQNPERKLRFYADIVEQASSGATHPRVLDIGCAFGLFLGRLGSRWERIGVDASEYAIRQARVSVPQARFEVCTAGAFPVTGPFDVVTAFDVLEHIPDVDATLSWITSNLRPGGEFVFVVPVYDGPIGRLVRMLDRDPSHVCQASREFWLSAASRHGRLIDWWGIFRYLVGGRFYLHAVGRAWRRVSPAIACRVRRPA